MTDDRDLDAQVRSWLDETPPGPPDRGAVYARVIDRLPQSRQRRQRWPFPWNPFAADATRSADANGPHQRCRSRTMLNATRVAAIVAALAMSGTLALVVGPFERHDRATVAPAAQAWTADDVVPVVSRAAYRGEVESGAMEVTPERVTERGTRMEYELTSDDPRFDGTMVLTMNSDAILGATGASLHAASVEVETVNGGWTGTSNAVGIVGTNDIHTQAILVGTGANQGLSAVLMGDNADNELEFEYSGMVFPGEMPPIPD